MYDNSDLKYIGFEGLKLAEVRENVDPDMKGKLKVWCPEINEHFQWTQPPIVYPTISTPNEHIKNDDGYDVENYQQRNYFIVRPVHWCEDNIPSWKYVHNYTNGGLYMVPRVGQKIFIFFQDGDPLKGFWLPFTPRREDEEVAPRVTWSPNWNIPEKRPDISSKSFWNGNVIEMDTNEDNNVLSISIVDETANIASPINNDGNYLIELAHSSLQGKKQIHLKTPKLNEIFLDDENNRIMIKTENNSCRIIMNSDGTINIEADKSINLKAPIINLN